ncbi:acyl-ACP thioesterase domain-containing protein [Acidithrix ferrooxidans]|uniref:Acyl-ACP thioesterase n=1 Tax=Acidithrix ferrooxidans TaxID=1280514 RepID=A0A0D8HJK9_9ACTN|nr:acyl-ACP thioesterase domain-containing protein [Acidithrix ferrooxidans]KJF18135.1 acyl-ACP thioesterase [Acidithrix ferrooxidans]
MNHRIAQLETNISKSPLTLIEIPKSGRVFTSQRRLGLGDCDTMGRLRIDSAVRIAQDIAASDLIDSGLSQEGIWVVRRTAIEFLGDARYQDLINVSTFCAGVGRAWAQRRTTIQVEEKPVVEISSLWIQTDPITRTPKSTSDSFLAIFGPSAFDRQVTHRLALDPHTTGKKLDWTPRFTDYDLLGHINNSTYFEAAEELINRYDPPKNDRQHFTVVGEYRAGIELGRPLSIAINDLESEVAQIDFVCNQKSECSIWLAQN